MSAQPPFTSQTQATGVGRFNRTAFLVEQILRLANIATLCRVEACTNDGGLTESGTVDVTPLVNQVDSQGNPTPHGVVYGLLYFRMQGGPSAVIMDPKKGDIGICVFSDRDLSAVKAAKAQANPGSFRRNDYADGMYLGGWGNESPTQYVRFYEGGMDVVTPGNLLLKGAAIQMQGPVTTDSTVSAAGEVTAMAGPAGVALSTHLTAAVTRGVQESDPPVPGT